MDTIMMIFAAPVAVFLCAAAVGLVLCLARADQTKAPAHFRLARAAPPAPALRRWREYLLNLLIWLDQGANTVCGGSPDETISSACYRFGARIPPKSGLWWCAYKGVNLLFFWQRDHCRMAYQSELDRKHLPPDIQSAGAARSEIASLPFVGRADSAASAKEKTGN